MTDLSPSPSSFTESSCYLSLFFEEVFVFDDPNLSWDALTLVNVLEMVRGFWESDRVSAAKVTEEVIRPKEAIALN